MVQITHALLVLKDGRFVFQRRTKDAKVNPGMLGFFGGHIEKGETPVEALKRELREETSLNVKKLAITPIAGYGISNDILNANDDRNFHLFRVEIPNSKFEVYEGDAAEAYSREEALARSDLLKSVRYALEQEVKNQ